MAAERWQGVRGSVRSDSPDRRRDAFHSLCGAHEQWKGRNFAATGRQVQSWLQFRSHALDHLLEYSKGTLVDGKFSSECASRRLLGLAKDAQIAVRRCY